MPRKLTLKLTPRSDGRFCKRIDGQMKYWSDAESARRELLALIAIKESNPNAAIASAVPAGTVSVKDVFNGFIADRLARVTDGRIKKSTLLDYKDSTDSFIEALESWKPVLPDAVSLLRRAAPVAILTPAVFRHARAAMGKGIGACALDRRVQGVRTAFKWAWEIARLIPSPPHYGDDFHKPTKGDKRADKRKSLEVGGEHRFTPAELKRILKSRALTGALTPMVWLALNGGMYATDCASLRRGDIKRDGRFKVIDTYRPKTEIRQKFPLWPQTIAALRAWEPLRHEPHDSADEDLVFLTVRGKPWANDTLNFDEEGRAAGGGNYDAIGQEFNKLLALLKIKRVGVGFGAFRHTHISAAARCADTNARKVVRGHKVEGIEEHYDFQDLDRLKAVTDVVYATLIKPILSNKSPARSKRPPKPLPRRTAGRKPRVGSHA